MTEAAGYPKIAAALVKEDYPSVIRLVRNAVAKDQVAALSDPRIQDWLARRYRNLFLNEAEKDESALRVAKVPMPMQLLDRRSSRELLAARFLKGLPRTEAQTDMPRAHEKRIKDTTLLCVPGLLAGLLPVLAFQSVWPRIEERFGIRILTADVHPARSSADNAADIKAALDEGVGFNADSDYVGPKSGKPVGDVVIMGYSKGAADALEFLIRYPEQASRVRAFIGWAGVIGGSYIADETEKRLASLATPTAPLSGEIGRTLRQIVPVVQIDRVGRRLEEYDVKAGVLDMTTPVRQKFLHDHIEELAQLRIPTFTVSGATSLREVPYYQAVGVLQLNNYDKNNDMLLTQSQTQVPIAHSTHLAAFRAHHWDLAFDPFPWFTRMGSLNVDHKFARYPAMAALLLFLSELGLMK